jgi:hypothetical protein
MRAEQKPKWQAYGCLVMVNSNTKLLPRMYQDNQKAKDEFVKLGVLNEGTNIFRYALDSLNGLAAGFGVTFTDDLQLNLQKMKLILEANGGKTSSKNSW